MANNDDILSLKREILGLKLMMKATYSQTKPKINWIISATIAIVVTIPGLIIGIHHMPEEAQQAIDNGLDWTANQTVIAGRAWADFVNNADRSYTAPNGSLDLIGLTAVQACRWRHAVRMAESSGKYNHPGNQYGYFAGYGMGAEALSIVGLIKRSAFKSAPYAVRSGNNQTAWLNSPENWTLQGGKGAFLTNPLLQDVAVTALANVNIQDGFSNHILSQSKPEQIAGFAAAAHIKGLNAAISWYLRSSDSSDANGTKTSAYAAMGEASISKQIPECGDGGNITPPSFLNRIFGN